MLNAVGTRENIRVIDSSKNGNMRIDVLEYENLQGLRDAKSAINLYFMSKQNIRAKQIAIYLDDTSIQVEPGAMSYFQGNIEMVSGVTMKNAIGRVFQSITTNERFAQPEYKGTGMVVLEPSFKHFLTLELEKGERIIVDKGMYYCAQGTVQVKPVMQSNISSALLGGEGIFQLELTGYGLVVLECPVPMSEINMIELNGETLKVDGNFAILRTGNIEFTVEKSAKTLFGSLLSGEGLVNVYRGVGQVWLAPTIKVYDTLSTGVTHIDDMNMNTSSQRVTPPNPNPR